MAAGNDTRRGIILMALTMVVFASQDGLSRYLAERNPVMMIVMVRYWFFAAFVIVIARRQAGSIRAAAATRQPLVQIARGLILAFEICIAILSFVYLGLVEAHAIFAVYPLIIAALAGPVLGETMGWRRWTAVGVGFIGVLIILRPGVGVFEPAAFLALASALMFAVYGLLTRYAARLDTAATSFFWTGTAGAVALTAVGIWSWVPMTGPDWAVMAVLCATGATGHYLLIKVYEVAEAGAVQPFAYLHLVFASAIGILFFDDILHPATVIGALVVVGAGLFALMRARAVQAAPVASDAAEPLSGPPG